MCTEIGKTGVETEEYSQPTFQLISKLVLLPHMSARGAVLTIPFSVELVRINLEALMKEFSLSPRES